MANKKYEEADVQAIAVAIREKTGSENTYNVSEMANGVNEVYEAGEFDEKDKFWENALSGGLSSMSLSGSGWNDETFQPTRNIWCASGNNGNWFFSGNKITSVKKALAIHNVSLNTKNLHSIAYAFYSLVTVDLPELDFTNVKNTSQFDLGLRGCANLVTIDKVRLTENWTSISSFGGFMRGNSKLKNIVFEGVIPATISFSSCPLTVESMKSIITHLKNYSGTESEYAYTLTLKASCVTELETAEITDEDKNLLEEKGIVVSDDTTWVTVIDNLKWNLVTA